MHSLRHGEAKHPDPKTLLFSHRSIYETTKKDVARFTFLPYLFMYFVWMWIHACHSPTYGGQKTTYGSRTSPSTMTILVIQLRSSELVAGAFTGRALLPGWDVTPPASSELPALNFCLLAWYSTVTFKTNCSKNPSTLLYLTNTLLFQRLHLSRCLLWSLIIFS